MKLYQTIFAVCCFFNAFKTGAIAAPSNSDYTEIRVQGAYASKAAIQNVVHLESRVIRTVGPHYENREIEIVLGIASVATVCESVKSIIQFDGQRSLDAYLNPSDTYFRVLTNWKPGCATNTYGKPQLNKIRLRYFVDQREASHSSEPWPTSPAFWDKNVAIKFFSFDIGMMAGFNRWNLYRLDMLDINNPKFEFKKTFTYVQGESVSSGQ